MTTTDYIIAAQIEPTSPPLDSPGSRRQSLRTGLGSGLLGGLCCISAAVATAAGLGAAGFFTGLMERYQLHFVIASIAIMAAMLLRQLRRKGVPLRDLRAVARTVGRHALVMGVVYLITLGIAAGAAQLLTR